MRIWKRPIALLVLVVLLGCSSPKKDPTLVPSLEPTQPPATTVASAVPTQVPPTATPVPTPTPTPVPLAARVNGQDILLADFEHEVARAGDVVTRREVMDAMIETVLLEQAAASAGVTITDEQLDEIIQTDIDAVGGREVFEARLASNDLTEQEYRDKVRANLVAQRVQMQVPGEVLEAAEHVHARHILVATQEEAEAILAQLRDGADFATLAQTYSLDVSTRGRGGDLGFFPQGLLLTPELEEVAFALGPGQISDVIHSELLGYHIIQVLERQERAIDEQGKQVIRENQIRRWRESLWADADVERFIEP